jgi:hypothetical protein
MLRGRSGGRALVKVAVAVAGLVVITGAIVVSARTNFLAPAPEPSFTLPSPSPTISVDEVRKKFWRSHGVVDPPPPEIFEVPGPTRVSTTNQTGNAVSALDATTWFNAFRRSFAAKIWAIEHYRHDVVQSDVLGTPGLNGADVQITAAEKAGASRYDFSVPVHLEIQLVNLTPAQAQQMAPGKNASHLMILTIGGAFTGAMVFPDGHSQAVFQQGATDFSRQLIVGEFRDDPVSGGLWYMTADLPCGRPLNKTAKQFCELNPPA